MSDNDLSTRCWNEQSGPRWVAQQDRIDAQLAELGRAALARLAPRPGERIVDVGCGCGHTLLELAELVGETGRVLGVDISEPMLARARENAAQAGAAQVDVVCADAELHAFERGAFDAIFSRFGVMFFNDPRAAFRNLARAIAPDGRLGFVCWQALEDNAWAGVPFAAVRDLLSSDEAPAPLPYLLRPGAPGPFSLADRAGLAELLEQAGFVDVALEDVRRPLWLGGAHTLDEAVDFAMQIGPASHLMRDTDPSRYPLIAEALRQALAPYAGDRGVWLDGAAWVVSARARP